MLNKLLHKNYQKNKINQHEMLEKRNRLDKNYKQELNNTYY